MVEIITGSLAGISSRNRYSESVSVIYDDRAFRIHVEEIRTQFASLLMNNDGSFLSIIKNTLYYHLKFNR